MFVQMQVNRTIEFYAELLFGQYIPYVKVARMIPMYNLWTSSSDDQNSVGLKNTALLCR